MPIDLTDARALTLKNPWPFAITDLGKRVENRTWDAPPFVDTLFIHSGKGWDKNLPTRIFGGADANAPRSAIVAIAQLAYCCDASVGRDRVVCACGEWAAAGQYHWRLADELTVLASPVPCRGALGLWRPSDDVLNAIRGQVA